MKGNNDYPQTPTEAYNLLVNYRYNNKRNITTGGLDQVAFLADRGKKQKREYPHIQCFNCQKHGHYRSDCPELNSNQTETTTVTATTLMTRAVVLSARNKEAIDPMWVLCDTESTIDIVKNPTMITNLRQAKHPIELTGIKGGPTKINVEGDLLGYGTVYYHPDVAANILSFFNMTKRFKSVRYDNTISDTFFVMRDDDTTMEFKRSPGGLYYYDFNESIRRRDVQKIMMVTTVEEIKRNLSRREIEAAEAAGRLFVIVGRPSRKAFKDLIKRGRLLNNPVTIQDYRNALQLYGEDLGVLKGKTTRTKPEHITVDITLARPRQRDIILSVDIMYFTGIPFLITVSRNVLFITATVLSDRKKHTIRTALQQVFRIYQGRGHRLDEIEFFGEDRDTNSHATCRNEFQMLKDDLEEYGINIHVVSKEEHVPEVERQNRVIKERARGVVQTLPYKSMPRKMRVALIQYIVFWLNNIPKEGQDSSPREIIMGEQALDFSNLCRLPFGAYTQVHEDPQITNTMEPRTTGGINLGPSNMTGAHKFLSLATGEIITRRK